MHFKIILKRMEQRITVDLTQIRCSFQIRQKWCNPALTIRLAAVDFIQHPEPAYALKRNENTPIAGFRICGYTPKTTNLAQLRSRSLVKPVAIVFVFILVIGTFHNARLDHRDNPLSGQRIFHHFQIARLENIQRQLSTGQKQRASQWEDRHQLRYISARPVTGIAHLHYTLP
ncbi:hypothetical protein D3C80_1505330 [compost metagenome]